jgi:putative transposase
MVVMTTIHYRMYPSTGQQRRLARQLEACRWRWNSLLAERKQAWEEEQERIDYAQQQDELPRLKATVRPGVQHVHSQVVQVSGRTGCGPAVAESL